MKTESLSLFPVVPAKNKSKKQAQEEVLNVIAEIMDWGYDFRDFDYDLLQYSRRFEKDLKAIAIINRDENTGYHYTIGFAFCSVQPNTNTNKLRCQITRIGVNPNHNQEHITKQIFETLLKNEHNLLGKDKPEEFSCLLNVEKEKDKQVMSILSEMGFTFQEYQMDAVYAEKYMTENQRGE